jgi:hypothetical protein
VQRHRRDEIEQAADAVDSAKHRFSDCFSKREKRPHFANEENRSDAIHENRCTSYGKAIPPGPDTKLSRFKPIRRVHTGHGD